MASRKLSPIVVLGLLILGACAYLSGLGGPFFFDDNSNLLDNTYVQIRSLDYASLHQAAFSLAAGPLQRPIAMLSFALNYYFAGGFGNPASFKIVNLAIHVLNGFLVYWLTRLIVVRVASLASNARSTLDADRTPAVIALIWLVHPIQLTSVLYVVQRMTELSALFTLLGLLCYLGGRNRLLAGHTSRGVLLIFLALTVCWPLGLYSKETAALLPLFMLVLDYVLFATDPPWNNWATLSRGTRYALLTALALALMVATTAAIFYALPGYAVRTFTMTERLMTEARVLLFYLSLMLVPRLDAFGLFHDDLPISTSLITPWTTLPSILLLVLLVATGFRLRKKNPLVSLGILWFFAGHVLESTVLALEVAHEHRNYLPSIGVLYAAAGVLSYFEWLQRLPYVRMALLFAVLIPAGITTLRASQWSSEREMAYYDAMHHPDSPASVTRYANVLLQDGRVEESMTQMHRVAELAPREAGYLMSTQAVVVARGGHVDIADEREIIHRLSTYPITPVTLLELGKIGDCVATTCRALQPFLESWVEAVLNRPGAKDRSFLYYLLGRSLVGQGQFNEAIAAYRRSYELDKNYVNPLLDLTELYLALDRPDYATVILDEIRRVNKRSVYKHDQAIEHLAAEIVKRQALHRTHASLGDKRY